MTLVVQIGNTDNRLSQAEWSEFVSEIRDVIREKSKQIYFDGGANWDAPKQNACWVFDLPPDLHGSINATLVEVRQKFRQDSVAVIEGETQFY